MEERLAGRIRTATRRVFWTSVLVVCLMESDAEMSESDSSGVGIASAAPDNGRHDFIELVIDLSSRLAGSQCGQVDIEVKDALRRIVEFFDADRGILYQVLRDEGKVFVSERVERSVQNTLPPFLDARGQFPWLYEQILVKHQAVNISSIDELPAEAALDREGLLSWESMSALFIPLSQWNTGDLILGLSCKRHHPDWSAGLLPQLRLLGETLASVLRRRDLEAEREEALRFELLMTLTSSQLASAWSDQIGTCIENALQGVLDFTKNDQAGFLTILEDTGQAYLSHLRFLGGISPAPKQIEYAEKCPWLYETIVKRQEVYFFNTLDDLPPEAAKDRQHVEWVGHRSGLFIPYMGEKGVSYIFAVVSNTREQRWSLPLIERLKALGGVFVNALARQGVAEAMRRSESGLLEAQRIAKLGSWEWDVLTGRVWTSSQTDSILGSRVTTYQAFLDSIHPDDRQEVLRTIEAGMTQPGVKFRVEHRIGRPDGEERIAENHFEITRSASEGLPRLFGTIQDITERRQRELELEALRSQQWHGARLTQIAVLISSLAHELCQPLTAILSNAQAGLRLIKGSGLNTDEAVAILEDIVADDKRAGHVIESLRTMMRRRTTEREHIDCAQMTGDVNALLRSEYIKQGVLVAADLSAGCHISGDRVQLQQVLINLIMNAMEAMRDLPADKRRLFLKVSCNEPGPAVFSVTDVGMGLEKEHLKKVFDAFWTTKPNGIGMGLPICRSIIEAHGGEIWAENNEGPGATFHFSIPAMSRGPVRHPAIST